jgi:hypothetical protein
MGFINRAIDWMRSGWQRLTGSGATMESERQKRLGGLRALYEGEQYEGKNLAEPWTRQRTGAPRVPLRQQKPAFQYDIPKVIVDRPTAMLFGENGFPEISFEPVNADEGAAEIAEPVNTWLGSIAEEGGLRAAALNWARQGATLGTGVLTWAVVEGRFEFTEHDATYCWPTFHPRTMRLLEALELRYKFPKRVRAVVDGRLVERETEHWHRESWDKTRHVVYQDAPVADGKEPAWVEAEVAEHNFGAVPAVWVRNLRPRNTGDIDGVSLLDGLADLIEDCDRTLSQKSRVLHYNAEPEKIFIGLPMDSATGKPLAVGGGASTSLPAGADAKLLELSGDGVKLAEEHVVAQRARALEVSRVVMPDAEKLLASARSGAALRILFAPTIELVGELRQSYGRALQDILMQIVRATREGKLGALGTLETPPPAIPDGKVCLLWGDYFEPTPEDLKTLSEAAVALKAGGVLSHETVVRFLASYFGVKDVEGEIGKIEEHEAKAYGDVGNQRPPKPGDPPQEDPIVEE